MEIRRVGENKVRCALTEDEIHELGFDIDEIIEDGDTTQRFMQVVLDIVEEREHINIENISPMVKTELLQNHSMAITFGGDCELSLKELVDTMKHIVSQLEPEHLEEIKAQAKREKEKKQCTATAKQKTEPMICALRFATIEDMRHMSRVCFPGRVPGSSLYKLQGNYYLVLDFTGFTKEDMRPFAFGTVEYDNGHYSDTAQIAHIMEQGSCIMKNDALGMLMQL